MMTFQPSLDLRYLKLPHPRSARALDDLSSFEHFELEQLARNRNGWLAARWIVKRLLSGQLETPEGAARPIDISVLSQDDYGRPQRPMLLLQSSRFDLSVSISHTPRGVLVGLAHQPGIQIGVDLAPLDRPYSTSNEMWFTSNEKAWLSDRDPSAAAQFWTIKQAFYKATNQGEPFRPRQYEVRVDNAGDYQCFATGQQSNQRAQVITTSCDDHAAALVVQLPRGWSEARIN